MVRLKDGMLLYHGSYTAVSTICLDRCAPGKDFGRGFYLTSDESQARRFIPTSLRKARSIGNVAPDQSYGYISIFRVKLSDIIIKEYEFESANSEWLRYISLNRRHLLADKLRQEGDGFIDECDVIVGKVANDTTNTVITTYLNGLYGEVGSDQASRMAITLLMPDRLKDQFCFKTQRSLTCLHFEDAICHEV